MGLVRSNRTENSVADPSLRRLYVKELSSTVIHHTFPTAAGSMPAVKESAGKNCVLAEPVFVALPPYCVTASSVPSACRWSCLSWISCSLSIVNTQVRDKSSPTKKGIRKRPSSQLRTCMTNFPENRGSDSGETNLPS